MSDLSNIAVGDDVMVTLIGWGINIPRRLSVRRVLKRQIELEDGTKWSKNGHRIGAGMWSREAAAPWDDAVYQERLAAHKADRLKTRVCQFFDDRACNRLTLDQWEQVRAICVIEP